MKKEHRLFNLEREISFPKWLGIGYRFHIRTVLQTLSRLLCWSAIVWLVWNHALAHFFNTAGIGPLLSLALGTFLHAISTVLDDREF